MPGQAMPDGGGGGEPPLRVFPPRIEYASFETGTVYSTVVTIKNVSSRAMMYWIKPPTMKQWTVNGNLTTVKLAPGLESQVTVSFMSRDEKDITDRLLVATEGQVIEIPLRASAPTHKIVAEGDLDIGVIAQEQETVRKVLLRNEGPRDAGLSISYDKSVPGLTVELTRDTLAPAGSGEESTAEVVVTLLPERPGLVNTPVTVMFADNTPPIRMQLVAQAVVHAVKVTDEDGIKIDKLALGTAYLGQPLRKTFLLANDGPKQLRYRCHVLGAADVKHHVVNGEVMDEGELNKLGTPPSVKIEPQMGALMPFERQAITVEFVTEPFNSRKGFLSTLNSVDQDSRNENSIFLINFGRSAGVHVHQLPLTARAVRPGIKLEPAEVIFPDVTSGQHMEEVVKVLNLDSELPAVVHVPSSAYFHPDQSTIHLQPGQTATLVVSYVPRSMGRHTAQLSCRVTTPRGAQLQECALALSGTCLTYEASMGTTRGTLGRPPLPEDFERPRVFAAQQDVAVAQMRMTSSVRLPLWEKEAAAREFFALHRTAETENAFSLEQAMAREAHRQMYTDLLRSGHRHRKRLAQPLPAPDDPVSLGLQQAAGLKEPKIRLPSANEPLWLQEKIVVRPKHRAPIPNDPRLVTKCRFKSRPETEKEKADCKSTLLGPDTAKIAACRFLDYGQVALGQSEAQNFAVTNGLSQNLWVEIDLTEEDCEELADITPRMQVVPPRATAAFTCRFTATNPGSFEFDVPYTINGQRYTFRATADVVPVRVELNSEKLHFQFSPENWTGRVDQTLGVENPFDFPVVFTIEPSNKVFSVEPARGVLDARGKTTCRVRWSPVANDTVGDNNGVLTVHVKGELTPKKVMLQGELPEGRLQLVGDKAIDFDVAAVGVPKSKVVVLRNAAPHESQFQVIVNHEALRANPMFGRVPAKGSLELDVSLEADEPCAIEDNIVIEVRGGRSIKIPVKGKVVVPDIYVEEDKLDFGGVIVGGAGKLDLTLVNSSPVQGAVVLDLMNYNEFSVELSRDAWSSDVYEHCPVQVVSSKGTERSAESVGSERGVRRRSSVVNQLFAAGSKYRITIMGHSKLCIVLVYKPTSVGGAELTLGLSDGKGLTPPEGSLMAKRIPMTMTGLEPKLILSETVVDFGKRVVVRGSSVNPYTYTLHLASRTSQPLPFRFAVSELCPPEDLGVFSFEPQEGTLNHDTPLAVRVLFLPRESKTYSLRVPLYANHDFVNKYLELTLSGTGSMPRLLFDVEEVLLPPVPLGIRASAQVMVINDGYDNLDLKVKMPVDEDKVPITVDFPDGTMIGVAKERLALVVSFVASKPTSFTSSIELLDFEGARYKLPISGVSDNSVLTAGEFLHVNHKVIGVARKTPRDPPRLAMAAFADLVLSADLKNVGPLEPNRFLACFINATTMLGPFNNLREESLASKGRILVEIVELLSGKPVPGKAVSLPASRREAMIALLSQYEKLIQFLASLGALLNTTKPEFLLDTDDFARLLSMREVQSGQDQESARDARVGLTFWEQVETSFGMVSVRAWNAVFAQVAKVLVVSRCTPKALRQMGLPVTKELEKMWSSSDVYSLNEMVLLYWAQHWLSKTFPESSEILGNFNTDFRNGRALFAILASHWPSLGAFRDRLLPDDNNHETRLHNAQVLLEMVRQLELPMTFTATELLEANVDEVVLLLAYLFQTLPQLAPRTTIEFSAKLGEVQTKHVELHNPSPMAVSYYARLEGHSDFALTTTTVFLEPKATVHFPVQCKSTISKPVQGFLVLSSRRNGTAHGATLVFALESQVNTTIPVQKASVEGTTYQMEVAEAEIRNPFPGDCDFTITLEQYMQTDGRRKKTKKSNRFGGGRDANGDEGNATSGAAAGGIPPEASPSSSATHRLFNPDARTVIASGVPLSVAPERYPHAFGCERQRLRLRQGAVDRLDLAFLPFVPGVHICHIVLEDATFGKFRCEVVGNAKLPMPVAKLTYQCDQEGSVVQDISIPFANTLCEGAKRLFLERHPLAKDDKQAGRLKALDAFKGEPLVYTVEQANQFVNVPRVVVLKGVKQPDKQRGDEEAASSSTNSIRVELNPKGAGLYPVRVKLTSVNDVRVYDLTFEATKAGMVSKLEFDCPARHQVQQEIPLVNHSDKPLQVRANIQGETFFGPAQLTIDPGLTLMYPLSCRTNAPGNYYGKLELQIPSTGELNIYELRGTATAPLAEQHMELTCQARTESSLLLTVPNIKQTATSYQVLADLPFLTGDPVLDVPAGSKGTYELKIRPQRSGKYLGSVMFSIDKNNYVWFTMDITVETPPATDSMVVECGMREAVQLEIPLENPVDRNITFAVTLEGASLIGPKDIRLLPSQKASYRLYCSPLLAGFEACKVRFNNEELGEFWYHVDVQAAQPPPTNVPIERCELGRSRRIEVPVSNPLDAEVTFAVAVDNTSAFAVASPTLTLGPFASAVAAVDYIPSALGEVDEGVLRLTHKRAGIFEFRIAGEGTKPGDMGEVAITSVVGQTGTGMVVWSNPFRMPVAVDLDLVEEGQDPSFKILLKRTESIVVHPGAHLQIPIAFSPLVHTEHIGELQVAYDPGESDEDVLIWRYPIHGQAEVPHMGTLFRITGKARIPIDEEIHLQLPGVGRIEKEEHFTPHLEIAGDVGGALASAIKIVPVVATLRQPTDRLVYRVQLLPQAAVSKAVNVILQKSTGGRWRFDIRLDVAPPDVVDTIEVEATVGTVGVAPIWLFSPSAAEETPFLAMLSHDSAAELSVEPAQGMLPLHPAGFDPSLRPTSEAPIRISFAPLMYGSKKTGKLVVQAGADQYTYQIIGKLAVAETRRTRLKSTFQTSLQDLPPAVTARVSKDNEAMREVPARKPKNFVASNLRSVARASIFVSGPRGSIGEERKSKLTGRNDEEKAHARVSIEADLEERGMQDARVTRLPTLAPGARVSKPEIRKEPSLLRSTTKFRGEAAPATPVPPLPRDKRKAGRVAEVREEGKPQELTAVVLMRQRMQTVGFL